MHLLAKLCATGLSFKHISFRYDLDFDLAWLNRLDFTLSCIFASSFFILHFRESLQHQAAAVSAVLPFATACSVQPDAANSPALQAHKRRP